LGNGQGRVNYAANTVYVNEKMILLKLLANGGKERRIVEGMSSSMTYLTYCKNFCKCHNVASTTIKNPLERGKNGS
jgi:hypothetical protein